MEILKCNVNNLASVLLGKGIYIPWRGQPDLLIQIPFNEWIQFTKRYRDTFNNRSPIKYSVIYEENVAIRQYRYYLFDCGWALYNEVMCSANMGLDATLILPNFEDGSSISILDALEEARAMDDDTYNKYYRILARAKPLSPQVPFASLSTWNSQMLLLSVYLVASAYQKSSSEKFNIEWR